MAHTSLHFLPTKANPGSSFSRSVIASYASIIILNTAQIVRDTSVARPSYQTRCKIGVPFVVALYTETPLKDRDDLRYCSPGNVLCLTSARPKTFLDGSTGFRVEDASTIQVCKSSVSSSTAE